MGVPEYKQGLIRNRKAINHKRLHREVSGNGVAELSHLEIVNKTSKGRVALVG
jgi:hypothetical protein